MTETKRCTRCRQQLPIDAFAIRRASPDGRQNYCRACASEWARLHRPRKLKDAPDVGPGEKWCRRCESIKPLSQFARNKSAHDGHQGQCRSCAAAAYRLRRADKGHVSRPADVPAGHKFCRGCRRVLPVSEWSARINSNDGLAWQCKSCLTAKDRAKHLMRTYGMSVEDLDAMLAAQHGACAICQTAPAVHVDHDHQTDKVRGLLCFRCNAALGQFGDDPLVLRRAARYVERGGFRAVPDRPLDVAAESQREAPSVMERILRARLADADFGTAS
jgi:Recombination endonuclease VII